MWNQENTQYFDRSAEDPNPGYSTNGGRGYFGTIDGGCDYQFSAIGTGFVIGAFANYDFANIQGTFDRVSNGNYDRQRKR